MRFYCLPILLLLYCLHPVSMLADGLGDGIAFTFFPESKTSRFDTYFPRSIYLEPGLGAGAWYQSDQVNMKPQQLPLLAFMEVSKDLSPLSYGISINTFTFFRQRDFVLHPEYASLYARYSFGTLFPFVPPPLDIFVMGGITAWQAELRDGRAPGFRAANPVEHDQGMGWLLGAGLRYYVGSLGVGAQWNYFNTQASFLASADEAVRVEAGTAQLQLTLSYRFRLGDPIKCPTFR